MVRRSSRGSRVVSGALALALALVSVATCFAGTLQLTQQSPHASCHGMPTENAAPSSGTVAQAAEFQARDCCAVQRAILGLGGAFDAVAPPASTAALVVPLSPLEAPPFDSRAPISSSPPTYLLLSVFRV